MMETSDARQSDDLGVGGLPGLGLPAFRGVGDRGVDSLVIVVVDVLAEEPSQMALAEDDDVVEKLPANAPDEALGRPVLPWALE